MIFFIIAKWLFNNYKITPKWNATWKNQKNKTNCIYWYMFQNQYVCKYWLEIWTPITQISPWAVWTGPKWKHPLIHTNCQKVGGKWHLMPKVLGVRAVSTEKTVLEKFTPRIRGGQRQRVDQAVLCPPLSESGRYWTCWWRS